MAQVETMAQSKPLNQAVTEWWARLRAGHEMAMLDDARRTLKADRDAVKRHRHKSHAPESDDMGDMILGNVEHHYHDQKDAFPAPAKSLGTAAKLAIGAALMGTGAGAGIGLPLLLSGGKEVVERVETIDNTRSIVPGFGQPD